MKDENNNPRTELNKAIRDYNKQLVVTAAALKDADPRPGKMTKEQEQAQIDLVSAYIRLEDIEGEFSEADEIQARGNY